MKPAIQLWVQILVGVGVFVQSSCASTVTQTTIIPIQNTNQMPQNAANDHAPNDIHEHEHEHTERAVGTLADFQKWQARHPYESQKAKQYQDYLQKQLGSEIPPMHELLTTARSWQKCGYEPYQVPPQELWANIVPTLRLYNTLKWNNILPASTQIRSVYRNVELNRCAGGASGSKHMQNAAIDIWIPEYDNNMTKLYALKDELCHFWNTQGEAYQFGLGLYATGAIHIDTQGYRKWGIQFSNTHSPCRKIIEQPITEKLYIDGQF